MAAITTPTSETTVGEHVNVPTWSLLLLALALFGSYVMLQENGLIMSNWMAVHEFFHDARHALGFPCH
ncbi:CbtB-domain containing protein [Aquihabitans sp. G128]|uniref:CbtB domain-containing protein n=1 Tax=Aquihabitans sp. G128 TaxID=2849779 RepID=UPI001C222E80|nr:CbtB-domain containing protein [Aquihabitans sp. G128]QXC61132.1 CbtB-domain containing protein [Aquihabitans sp. G128]